MVMAWIGRRIDNGLMYFLFMVMWFAIAFCNTEDSFTTFVCGMCCGLYFACLRR